jgi:hypothetical protein
MMFNLIQCKMSLEELKNLQEQEGFAQLQDWIDSGVAWKMEGSVGRSAMDAITTGVCWLSEHPKLDYWGNRIPSRDEVKSGSKGSLQHSINFYSQVLN